MTDEQLKQYHTERKAIIKEYNVKAFRQAGVLLLIGIPILAAIALVCILLFDNIPLAAVLCLIWGLFFVIAAWMKILMINRAKEKKLQEFEDQSLLRKF